MDKKYVAVLFALVVAGAGATALTKVPSELLLKNEKWDDLGLNANINDYVETVIPNLINFIQHHGLDPMPLPDIEEGFEVRPILITYSAWLTLTEGYMSGLAHVRRYRDQNVSYFAKMMRVRLEFEATNLDFIYRYSVKVMNLGPRGGIVGSLDRLTIVADVLVDFNNDEIHLQEFALNDIGRLRVRLTGNPLTDWLVNPVITVFTMLFDTLIIRIVELNIRSAVIDGIEVINHNVKTILNNLESF